MTGSYSCQSFTLPSELGDAWHPNDPAGSPDAAAEQVPHPARLPRRTARGFGMVSRGARPRAKREAVSGVDHA